MFNVNEYFDGKVKSIAFKTNNDNATIGVMAAGEYVFSTASIELMTITSGQMQVKLPGSTEWETIQNGETFRVEADQSFDVKMDRDTSYLCVYKETD